MAGSVMVGIVVLAARILVVDDHADWSPQGLVLEDAAENRRRVVFVAIGGDVRLAGSTSGHLIEQVRRFQRDPCGHPVDDRAHRRAVGFTEGRQLKKIAECISVHGFISRELSRSAESAGAPPKHGAGPRPDRQKKCRR